jgi:galactitol-specific phosphotransferase system IIB component
MKFLVLLSFALLTLTANAGFEGLNQGTSINIFNKINCSTGVSCTRVKDKFTISKTGGLQNQVVATATTITAAQCGSTFINSGAVQMELPEASAVLGCRLTFITGNASNFDVNPDNADVIIVSTNVAGDAMRNATLGNSITLEALSATQWAVIAVNGTYTDIN